MEASVTCELLDDERSMALAVTGPAAGHLFSCAVPIGHLKGSGDSAVATLHDPREVLADLELSVAGWTRISGWTPAPDTTRRSWRAVVVTRPRAPITAADQRALETLDRLTVMARGPVTAAALVPTVAPRHQAATVVMTRLVLAGQVRAVQRSEGRRPHLLYAPVGSRWAPD